MMRSVRIGGIVRFDRDTASSISVVPALLLVLASTLALPAAEGQQPTSASRLEVDAKEVDLGTLYRGQEATARFSIRNLGDQPARILNVKPG